MGGGEGVHEVLPLAETLQGRASRLSSGDLKGYSYSSKWSSVPMHTCNSVGLNIKEYMKLEEKSGRWDGGEVG